MRGDSERLLWHIAHGDAAGALETSHLVLSQGAGSESFCQLLGGLFWQGSQIRGHQKAPLTVEAHFRGRPPLQPSIAPWVWGQIGLWSPDRRLVALKKAISDNDVRSAIEIIKRECFHWHPEFQKAVAELFVAQKGPRLRFRSGITRAARERTRRNNLIRESLAPRDKRARHDAAVGGHIAEDTARKILARERKELEALEADFRRLRQGQLDRE